MLKSNQNFENNPQYAPRYQYIIPLSERESLLAHYYEGLIVKSRNTFSEAENQTLAQLIAMFDEFNKKPFLGHRTKALQMMIEGRLFGKGVNVNKAHKRRFDVLLRELSQYLEVVEYARLSDDTMDSVDIVTGFFSNKMNMRIINILYHAKRATVGDIVAVIEYDSSSISLSMGRVAGLILEHQAIWKRVREYFIHPSVRAYCDEIYALIKDSEVLTADRARYDEIKASGLLPSDIEKNFGKTI